MDTIVERDSGSSSAITMVVAIVAIAVIAGIFLYMLKLYPFTNTTTQPGKINVEVNGQLPGPSSTSGY